MLSIFARAFWSQGAPVLVFLHIVWHYPDHQPFDGMKLMCTVHHDLMGVTHLPVLIL